MDSSVRSCKAATDPDYSISALRKKTAEDFAASGNGAGSSWNNRGANGNYWSRSFNSARNARNLNFNSGGVNPQNNNNRYNGFAVRPVQHLSIPYARKRHL